MGNRDDARRKSSFPTSSPAVFVHRYLQPFSRKGSTSLHRTTLKGSAQTAWTHRLSSPAHTSACGCPEPLIIFPTKPTAFPQPHQPVVSLTLIVQLPKTRWDGPGTIQLCVGPPLIFPCDISFCHSTHFGLLVTPQSQRGACLANTSPSSPLGSRVPQLQPFASRVRFGSTTAELLKAPSGH